METAEDFHQLKLRLVDKTQFNRELARPFARIGGTIRDRSETTRIDRQRSWKRPSASSSMAWWGRSMSEALRWQWRGLETERLLNTHGRSQRFSLYVEWGLSRKRVSIRMHVGRHRTEYEKTPLTE